MVSIRRRRKGDAIGPDRKGGAYVHVRGLKPLEMAALRELGNSAVTPARPEGVGAETAARNLLLGILAVAADGGEPAAAIRRMAGMGDGETVRPTGPLGLVVVGPSGVQYADATAAERMV